jgi:hypothetical protein
MAINAAYLFGMANATIEFKEQSGSRFMLDWRIVQNFKKGGEKSKS